MGWGLPQTLDGAGFEWGGDGFKWAWWGRMGWAEGLMAGGSPEEERDLTHVAQSTADIRDVFGDSDEEEAADYVVQRDSEQRSPVEEEDSYEKNLRPEDLVREEDARYGSEEEIEAKLKEKPVGPQWNEHDQSFKYYGH
ncbi:Protein LEO1-like protein [Bienertia sinuspersici]